MVFEEELGASTRALVYGATRWNHLLEPPDGTMGPHMITD